MHSLVYKSSLELLCRRESRRSRSNRSCSRRSKWNWSNSDYWKRKRSKPALKQRKYPSSIVLLREEQMEKERKEKEAQAAQAQVLADRDKLREMEKRKREEVYSNVLY